MAQFTTIPWVSRAVAVVAFLVLPLVSAVSASPSAWAAGTISVSFLYMPPSQIEPTYHTAIWLEDLNGRLVKTLFVSHDLSSTEYRILNPPLFFRRSLPMLSSLIDERGSEEIRRIELRDREAVKPGFAAAGHPPRLDSALNRRARPISSTTSARVKP